MDEMLDAVHESMVQAVPAEPSTAPDPNWLDEAIAELDAIGPVDPPPRKPKGPRPNPEFIGAIGM